MAKNSHCIEKLFLLFFFKNFQISISFFRQNIDLLNSLIPGKGAIKLVDPDQNAYTNLTSQLPKDYCLIPGNCTVKLVETQKSPTVNHFQFWFWPDTLQVHRSASNKMDISPDIDPT